MAGNSKLIVCKKAIFTPYTRNVWVSGGVREPGGGVLPMMAYTGRLRPKGVCFSDFRYMKGYGLTR